MQLADARLEMRKKYDKEDDKAHVRKSVKVKLPKLVISKFEGTTSVKFLFKTEVFNPPYLEINRWSAIYIRGLWKG